MTSNRPEEWESTAFHGEPPSELPVEVTARLRLAASIAERRGGWVSYPVLWVLDSFEADPMEVPLSEGRTEVGRELGHRFLRDARGLSRRHFAVWQEGVDWKIEDLASRNGTSLNGEKVEEATVLRDGDWIEAGHLLFVPNLPDLLTGIEVP